MNTAKKIVQQITQEAEKASSEPRWVRTCREGDEIRQGDIYLYPLGRGPSVGRRLGTRQLAPGQSQGSRWRSYPVQRQHGFQLHR